MERKRMLRALFRRYGKKVSCSVCNIVIKLRFLMSHFSSYHSNFDFASTCVLCLKNMSDDHIKICVQNTKKGKNKTKKKTRKEPEHFLRSIYRGQVRTEAAHRRKNYVQPQVSSRFQEYDLGSLVKPITFRDMEDVVYSTNMILLNENETKTTYQLSSLPSDQRNILVAQRNDDETLSLALRAVLSYEPNVWFHLILSVMHVAKFIELCRAYDDFFILDFWCWCDSKAIFKRETLPECQILHVHLLGCTSHVEDWKKKVWNLLRSPDGQKYKKLLPVHSVKYFGNVLLYLSQERWCNDEKNNYTKHFAIHRPIRPDLEPLVMLAQPTVVLDEIYTYMHSRALLGRFQIHRIVKGRRDIYFTPMAELMERLQHYTIPFCKGDLEKVSVITPNDRTLVRTADGRFINLIPGNKDITLAIVMNAAFPGMKPVWTKKKRGEAEGAFAYYEMGAGTAVGNNNGGNVISYYNQNTAPPSDPLVFERLDNTAGEINLSLDIETTGLSKQRDEIVQISLYGEKSVILNYYMTPSVPILPEATRVNRMQLVNGRLQLEGRDVPVQEREFVRSIVSTTLQGLAAQGLKVNLLAKNGNCLDFPMLKAFLGDLDGINCIDTEYTLRKKFEKLHPKSFTLEDYAAAANYTHYTRPLHDSFNDAKLHYELLCLKIA